MKYLIASILAVAILAIVFTARVSDNGGQFGSQIVTGNVTPQRSFVYTTSTIVAATSTGRIYFRVQNASTTIVDCTFGATAEVGKGIRLTTSTSSNSVFVMNESDGIVFPASFNCVSTGSTGGVMFIDVTGR